tara:strand:+ start:1969 stop:2112 length:144 start_codon:yes stop_codon:yes gene_type:complete
MEKPTLYKKISINAVQNRTVQTLTDTEKSQVKRTVTKFFELFVSKHL